MNVLYSYDFDHSSQWKYYHFVHQSIPFYVSLRLFYTLYITDGSNQPQFYTDFYKFFCDHFLKHNRLLSDSTMILTQSCHFLEYAHWYAIWLARTFFSNCCTIKRYLNLHAIKMRHFLFIFPQNPGIVYSTFSQLRLQNEENFQQRFRFVQRLFFANELCKIVIVLMRKFFGSNF